MNPIIECAERILLEHPHPALRLTELHELLTQRFDRSLEQSRLRGMLEEHQKVFRVLDPWHGPWRSPEQPRTALHVSDPWVVIVTHPDGADPSQRPTALKLRDSVRWLAARHRRALRLRGQSMVRHRSSRTASAQRHRAKGGLSSSTGCQEAGHPMASKRSERHSPSRSIVRHVNPSCSVSSRTTRPVIPQRSPPHRRALPQGAGWTPPRKGSVRSNSSQRRLASLIRQKTPPSPVTRTPCGRAGEYAPARATRAHGGDASHPPAHS